jgi:hypothetical protein
MFAVLLAAFALQTQQPRRPSVVRDSVPADSIKRRTPTRKPVTAEALRTAFADAQARELLLHARRARLTQDSSLKSYDAKVRERMTAKLAIGSRGPERVMYRQESAYRVQWQDKVGARIEVTGARVGIPIAPKDAETKDLEENMLGTGMTPVPYYPGQEAMWLGPNTVREDVDERSLVQPLAQGSEAYYTYATGDSMSWTLPDGRKVRLRELSVRPRTAEWNLTVGSLWFDVESGQLVRAAYRLAVPQDVWMQIERSAKADSNPIHPLAKMAIKAITSPMKVEISAVVVEYGLFGGGRYWLPRARSLQGRQQISFARMPVSVEQTFTYPSINGPETLTPVVLNGPPINRLEIPDSLTGDAARKWRDSVGTVRRTLREALSDSLKKAPCDSTGKRVVGRMRFDLPVAVSYPCDVSKLVASADFDKPIYDANESTFGVKERDALIADALPFGAQALIKLGALPRPTFQYGLSMTRYNRVEGLSSGIQAEQQFGAGYVAGASARIGAADLEPNVELSIGRTNLSKTVTLTGYNRLVSANDWGNPLSFGSSVSAFLFGRDEGFYYRASGAELRFATDVGPKLEWRLFGEQQRTARQKTSYSVGGSFVPNIEAVRGPSTGASVRWLDLRGVDPHGVRTTTDVRLEAAAGDSTYGRGALDFTVSSGIGRHLAAALTLSGGTSVGNLPAQRRWFLGGAQTIRGLGPDTARSGNAYWMTRAELGVDRSAYRTMLFGDLGWVGDRDRYRNIGRPLSSAGIGWSMMDGLVRFDVARGLHPTKQTRVSAYLNARF